MNEVNEIENMFDELWPILRSITGDGVRKTHDILSRIVPLTRYEIPSGTKVLDWTIPPEWVVREAYVINPDGRRILDIAENNLHLLNYSIPFQQTVSREELDQHLYSIPDKANAIPYVISYYNPTWGFCISHKERMQLPDGDYTVIIDTDHIQGSLTLSEFVLPGETQQEVFFHTYTCHPSLAHNELSGPLAAIFLARRLSQLPNRRLTYRFVFTPETIGAIAYLAMRGEELRQNMIAGYVITCVGDNGPLTYKYSRDGNTLADRVAEYVFDQLENGRVSYRPFDPYGSDQRQYCSQGYRLPVGSIMRTPYGEYPEYHTSLDNKNIMDFEAMAKTIDVYSKVVNTLELNRTYKNTKPYGEPQLEKIKEIYYNTDTMHASDITLAAKWEIHFCDGEHDLLDIANMSRLDIDLLYKVAERLASAGLFEHCD